MTEKTTLPLSREALEFAPGLLAIQEDPPRRLPRAVLYAVAALFVLAMIWMTLGRLDIVATARGRLQPKSYIKIVQPADSGIVEQILVHEDQHVKAGQVLMRLDPKLAQADTQTLRTELALRSLQLRRIDAELTGGGIKRRTDDPADLYRQVSDQLRAHRRAHAESLAQAGEALRKARADYESARQVLVKLKKITPILKQTADAYAAVGRAGYVPAMTVRDKRRQYLEKAQDLRAQRDTVDSMRAAVAEARRREAEIASKYRSTLRDERVDAESKYRKLRQSWIKQRHKNALLELRAPQAGIVENLATHMVGTVVAPGTVLLSLVPDREPLIAMVRVKNRDVGFVHLHEKVRIKIASYPFERYGTLNGKVLDLSPDATDAPSEPTPGVNRDRRGSAHSSRPTYKALIALNDQALDAHGRKLKLVPGMQVTAEMIEGKRSVLAYLLSPVAKTLEQSGEER